MTKGELDVNSTGKLEVVFFSTPESDIPSSSESTGIPLQHKFLTGNLPFQTLAAVSEDKIAIEHPENDIGSLALEGRVLQKAECQPPPNKKYMDMKVNHIEKISKPEKQIISINRAEVKFKPIARHAEDVTYGKRKGVKNVRLEKQSLLEILFQAFENHQYYKLVDLARVTQQPPVRQ
ncbi:unnamed protein product [Soboliphyme baturini]|uniref:TFIIF_beta domain-containing protein n=1 Tax=Soboliphyme baturini TaxID=241478 RepID=A0A183IAS2_9BILA|nr:unnamed protein product [Soboliphyme baturini]